MAKTPPKSAGPRKSYTHTAPVFVSLKPGQELTGVFVGEIATQYGPGYRFKTDQGIVVLSGNRYQLDSIFDEMELDTEAFPGGLKGHKLSVKRLSQDVKTQSGRTVGQYQVDHVYEGCPAGCVPF